MLAELVLLYLARDLSEGPSFGGSLSVTRISLQLGFFLISAEKIEGKQALATDSTFVSHS